MVRFCVDREEDEAEEGPGSSSSRLCPKRRKTSTPQPPSLPPQPSQPPPPPPQPSQPPRPTFRLDLCLESDSGDEIEDVDVFEEEEEEEEEEESDFEEEEEEDAEEDDQGEEELEHQQQPDLNEEPDKDGPISVTLTDPDVLDCPICLDSLSIPVFQCENGHVACSSCCLKIHNRCPSCSWPIGYNRCRAIEKVLESVKVSCKNMKYGCKQMMKYSNKHEHENMCPLAPCSCPVLDCNFLGSSSVLYSHFSRRHSTSSKSFFYNKFFSVSLERSQRSLILREDTETSIFVLNHFSEFNGSTINIVRIAPSPSVGLSYDLMARYEETSITLHSSVESIPKWVDCAPAKKFILVPNYFTTSSGQLHLEVRIWRHQESVARALGV